MARLERQLSFVTSDFPWTLPEDFQPECPRYFNVERVYFARGSLSTPERVEFVERICRLYPDAEKVACPSTSHNRIDLSKINALSRHRLGKKTLVFGELASAVRFSEEEGNTCPNYWHFSPYGFCFYDCKYCYLAGTRGFWFSPTIRIYVNLPEIIGKINRIANELGRPTAFYLGKLQDGLSLDPLTAYSSVLVPFFARHPYARQVILTKSSDVNRLLNLEHSGHTILSWSLNPPEVASRFEKDTPSIEERIGAMRQCADRGYPVRAVLMPVIPVDGWEHIYAAFVKRLLAAVPIQRLTMGGICSYHNAALLMQKKLGTSNAVSKEMVFEDKASDGRARYSQALRIRMYSELIRAAREVRLDIELALCLEEPDVWKAVDLPENVGRCNCVL